MKLNTKKRRNEGLITKQKNFVSSSLRVPLKNIPTYFLTITKNHELNELNEFYFFYEQELSGIEQEFFRNNNS